MRYDVVESPIGDLLAVGDGRALHRLHMLSGRGRVVVQPGWTRDTASLAGVRAQLAEYFAGERTRFDLPLVLRGSPFQVRVWQALLEIPYGRTATYGEIARHVGRPSGARAVGLANGRNPIAVVVPCHRVVGADGSLTGYGGGLERKRRLLELEADVVAPRL